MTWKTWARCSVAGLVGVCVACGAALSSLGIVQAATGKAAAASPQAPFASHVAARAADRRSEPEGRAAWGPARRVQDTARGAVRDRPYLEGALSAANWIRSTGVETERGAAWPVTPDEPAVVDVSLYSGVAGVVLFFLEAHATLSAQTDRAALAARAGQCLAEARRGADFLLKSIDETTECGLYTGLAGIGFTLHETFKATGDERYRAGARACVERLKQRAAEVGRGVQWSDVSDVIAGSAGIGLFLIYAARESDDRAALDLALRAGDRLIELGQPANGGLKWAMEPGFPREMPNFSHGTAGCAHFLATLYLETQESKYLEAALAGARYLLAIADQEGDGCLIYHHAPGGEDLFYLGWCHGPPGTARLFKQLHRATSDPAWLTWIERSAHSVLSSGIPAQETPGFWNNVGVCCGSAGVAMFMLDLHRRTGEARYLEFCRALSDDLLARAERVELDPPASEADAEAPEPPAVRGAEAGLRWVHAEHRARPELVHAQTGYMQGAAGIATWLLRFDAFQQAIDARIHWPDE